MLPDRPDFDSYGGPKVNARAIVDPTAEMDADDHNQHALDAAMMGLTSIRAVASYVGTASNPLTAPSSGNVHLAQWGSDISVKPTFNRTATGIVEITWPTTITDELGDEHTLNFSYALQPCISHTSAVIASATVSAANKLTIRTFDAAGVATDAVGAIITAYAI